MIKTGLQRRQNRQRRSDFSLRHGMPVVSLESRSERAVRKQKDTFGVLVPSAFSSKFSETPMSGHKDTILPYNPEDPAVAVQVEALLDRAFGIGRRTKTTYRLREGEKPLQGSCLAIYRDNVICAVISYWNLMIGHEGHEALMLGPIAVEPKLQGQGLGHELIRHSLSKVASEGHKLVILVGDEPYYGEFGFSRVPEGRLTLPGPVDPARLLYKELVPGSFDGVSGLVLQPSRHKSRQ